MIDKYFDLIVVLCVILAFSTAIVVKWTASYDYHQKSTKYEVVNNNRVD